VAWACACRACAVRRRGFYQGRDVLDDERLKATAVRAAFGVEIIISGRILIVLGRIIKEKIVCFGAHMHCGRREILPSALPPRGLSRLQAAAYIGVSPTLFDEMVADKRMPRPKRINRRAVWDRLQLDEAFAALPNDGEEDRADDVWSRCAV
jgi:predicted DNA-binding transcriptional regulator AlpA